MFYLAVLLFRAACLNVNTFLEHTDYPQEVSVLTYQISLIDTPPSFMNTNMFARDMNNGSSSTNLTDLCPADDSKIYYPANGYPYTIECGYYSTQNQTTIDSSYQPSTSACAERCAAYNQENQTTQCIGANYYAAGANDNPPIDCYLRSYVCYTNFPRLSGNEISWWEAHSIPPIALHFQYPIHQSKYLKDVC